RSGQPTAADHSRQARRRCTRIPVRSTCSRTRRGGCFFQNRPARRRSWLAVLGTTEACPESMAATNRCWVVGAGGSSPRTTTEGRRARNRRGRIALESGPRPHRPPRCAAEAKHSGNKSLRTDLWIYNGVHLYYSQGTIYYKNSHHSRV